VASPDGSAVSYTYDNMGSVLTQKDGNGNVTTYAYNIRGLERSATDALGKAETYTYSPDGFAASKTDRKGVATAYYYDIYGRLLTEDAGGDTVSHTYDANGNELTMTDSTGTTTRTYDALNRVLAKTVPMGANTVSFTFKYDLISGAGVTAGCFAEESVSAGKTVRKVYDKAGRLYQVYDNGALDAVNDNKHNFQKLTPLRDKPIGIYRDALDFVFENDDLRNIALSGAYSAGKSSVLESYKTNHTDKKFLHISLAHFNEVKVDSDNESEQNAKVQADEDKEPKVKESVLEGKILNQLIHQINTNRIPQTNFKIKRRTSVAHFVLSTLMILLLSLSVFHIVFFSAQVKFVSEISSEWLKPFLQFFAGTNSLLISGSICFIIFGMLLFNVIKLQTNKGIFKKISANKVEIEIFEKNDDSYFDKYLNEVLYLFDQSQADVIVFEDMDRYNANRIFERLREVNTLLNAQRRKHSEMRLTNRLIGREISYRPLRFFYLLRDDIFVSKDRTKFFDFIIPVVPVVDSSNSYDQFIAHMKEGGIFELFDESFLQQLSLYIDDMRILKNIYNEFTVYYSRLNTTELKPNKMLAIIAYKNLFPRDFSDLQLGKGFVSTLFKSRDKIVEDSIAEIDSRIEAIKAKMESAQNEHLESISEVDRVYETQLSNLQNQISYNYDNRAQSQKQLAELQKVIAGRKENIKNKTDEKVDEFRKYLARKY